MNFVQCPRLVVCSRDKEETKSCAFAQHKCVKHSWRVRPEGKSPGPAKGQSRTQPRESFSPCRLREARLDPTKSEREEGATLVYGQRCCPSRVGGSVLRKGTPQQSLGPDKNQPLDLDDPVLNLFEVPVRHRERRYSRLRARFRGNHPAPEATLL